MHARAVRHAGIAAVGMLLVGCNPATSPSTATSTREAPAPAPGAGIRAQAASPSTDVLQVPVAFTIQPSAIVAIGACVGEGVTFSGTANVVIHQTILPDGSTSLDLVEVHPQGAVATGASTGAAYRLAGGDSSPIILGPSGTLAATFAANLLVIGPGSAGSFTAHILQHITVTPAGEVTSFIDVFSIDCR